MDRNENGDFIFVVFLPTTYNSRLIMRKTEDRSSTKYLTSNLQTVMSLKVRKCWRNCDSQEERKDTW